MTYEDRSYSEKNKPDDTPTRRVPGSFVRDFPNSEPRKKQGDGGNQSYFKRFKGNAKRRLEKFRTILEIAVFVAIAFYTCEAHKQAGAMIDSNSLAQRRMETELRPYVAVGGPSGEIAAFTTVSQGKQHVNVTFFNAGKTPATHLSVLLWSNIKNQSPPWITRTRFRDRNSGAIIVNGGAEDVTLAAGASYAKPLSSDWEPSPSLLAEIEAGNSKKQFVVMGQLEYCDVFGKYRCDGFSLKYEPLPEPRFVERVPMECAPGIPQAPKGGIIGGIIVGKTPDWERVPRCNQPDEQKQEQ
jgi:hypothetical protein